MTFFTSLSKKVYQFSYQFFLEEYPETSAGVLIYTGNEIKIMAERIFAIPWYLFGGTDS